MAATSQGKNQAPATAPTWGTATIADAVFQVQIRVWIFRFRELELVAEA